MKASPRTSGWRRRRLFPRSLSEVMVATTEPLFKDKQQVTLRLMRDWARIMGDEMARHIQPRKLIFLGESMADGTLHLDVAPALAPEMPYRTEEIRERIACYFGFNAVARIVIHPHAPLAGGKGNRWS
jgi:hypothetical protein